MKNFISQNISYLCDTNYLKQNEFGELFGLGRSVVSMYVSGKSQPKIETLQRIGQHFKVNLDDFINKDLSTLAFESQLVNEPTEIYENQSLKEKVKLLEEQKKDLRMLVNSLDAQLKIVLNAPKTKPG